MADKIASHIGVALALFGLTLLGHGTYLVINLVIACLFLSFALALLLRDRLPIPKAVTDTISKIKTWPLTLFLGFIVLGIGLITDEGWTWQGRVLFGACCFYIGYGILIVANIGAASQLAARHRKEKGGDSSRARTRDRITRAYERGKSMLAGSAHSLRTMLSLPGYFFSRPWWPGIGAIAMVFVAIFVLNWTQSWEERRYAETIATVEIKSLAIVGHEEPEGNQTNKWSALIKFVNNGPAVAERFVISLVLGGEGIQPIGSPYIHQGNTSATVQVVDQYSWNVHPEGMGVYSEYCDVRVDELFIDDRLTLIQEFRIEEPMNSHLWANPAVGRRLGYEFQSGATREVILDGVLWWSIKEGCEEQLVAPFVREVSLIGERIRPTRFWRYPPPQEVGGLFKLIGLSE